jgi:hypothetical protein
MKQVRLKEPFSESYPEVYEVEYIDENQNYKLVGIEDGLFNEIYIETSWQ